MWGRQRGRDPERIDRQRLAVPGSLGDPSGSEDVVERVGGVLLIFLYGVSSLGPAPGTGFAAKKSFPGFAPPIESETDDSHISG